MNSVRDIETVQQDAERWFAHLRTENRSAAERSDFDAWLATDPEHAAAYSRTERIWNGLEELSGDMEIRRARHAARRSAQTAAARIARRWRLGIAASFCAAFVAAALVWSFGNFTAVQRYATAHGEQRSVVLADGSRVILNTDTALEVRLGRRVRSVRLLKGEALFEVTHDVAHPFVVQANGNTISDIGTRFDVHENGKLTMVTVLEGAVGVARDDHATQLDPGEQLIAGSGIWQQDTVDSELVTSWTQGRLVFRATPLAEAVAASNRYGQVRLIVADPRLAELKLSGQFRIGNTQSLVRALESTFPIRAVRDPNTDAIRLYHR